MSRFIIHNSLSDSANVIMWSRGWHELIFERHCNMFNSINCLFSFTLITPLKYETTQEVIEDHHLKKLNYKKSLSEIRTSAGQPSWDRLQGSTGGNGITKPIKKKFTSAPGTHLVTYQMRPDDFTSSILFSTVTEWKLAPFSFLRKVSGIQMSFQPPSPILILA